MKLSPKQDGSVYLAKIRFEDNTEDWELVSWEKPLGLSVKSCKPNWCNQGGFVIRIKEFISAWNLNDIIIDHEFK